MACILLKCQTMSGILQLIPNTEREKTTKCRCVFMRTGCLHTILKITDSVCYFQNIVA